MTLAKTAPVTVSPGLALLAAGLAALAFVGMDATIKSLGDTHHALQLTFLRFASGSVYAIALWAWFRSPLPTGRLWNLHLARSALLLVTLTSYFHALTVLPLAQAVAIGYMAPIFISLFAVWFLKERPTRGIWGALALGLAGTLVALWPELQQSHTPQLMGVAAAAFSAVSFAAVMVLARVQAQRDALWTIVLVQNVLPTVVLAVPMWWLWQPVAMSDWPAVALAGALATLGLLGITFAFKHVEASKAAPLEYTGLIWAGVLGFVGFGEVPSAYTLASGVLIVLGCLLLLRRH